MERKSEEILPLEENEIVNFDKMYFLNFNKFGVVIGKLSLFAIVGVMLTNLMMQEMPIWAKIIFGLGGLLLASLTYYDVKYMMGLKKYPFMIFPEKKTFRYYNEFEGNKEIDLMNVEKIKVYRREKGSTLLEVFFKNQKEEENMNISGFDEATVQEMLKDICLLQPNIVLDEKIMIRKKQRKSKGNKETVNP